MFGNCLPIPQALQQILLFFGGNNKNIEEVALEFIRCVYKDHGDKINGTIDGMIYNDIKAYYEDKHEILRTLSFVAAAMSVASSLVFLLVISSTVRKRV